MPDYDVFLLISTELMRSSMMELVLDLVFLRMEASFSVLDMGVNSTVACSDLEPYCFFGVEEKIFMNGKGRKLLIFNNYHYRNHHNFKACLIQYTNLGQKEQKPTLHAKKEEQQLFPGKIIFSKTLIQTKKMQENKKYRCRFCTKVFTFKKNCMSHVRAHRERFGKNKRCTICGRKVVRRKFAWHLKKCGSKRTKVDNGSSIESIKVSV